MVLPQRAPLSPRRVQGRFGLQVSRICWHPRGSRTVQSSENVWGTWVLSLGGKAEGVGPVQSRGETTERGHH